MKKHILLFSIIINYIFCYGDLPPSWEPFKRVSKNGEYFCWIDFNDNDTSKYNWKRKWILKVYDKDSNLFWQKEYPPLIYAGSLSNDGKKFVCIASWYHPDYPVVKITNRDKPDICIKGSEFNIPEESLIKTVSHKLWRNNYVSDSCCEFSHKNRLISCFLRDNELVILTVNRKVWIIDIETGAMKLSENGFWDLWEADYWVLYFILFSLSIIIGGMSVIKTIGNVRRKRLFFRTKYKNNTKKRTLKR